MFTQKSGMVLLTKSNKIFSSETSLFWLIVFLIPKNRIKCVFFYKNVNNPFSKIIYDMFLTLPRKNSFLKF